LSSGACLLRAAIWHNQSSYTKEHMKSTLTDTTVIHEILSTVCDPEIPVLTIADLGIIRDILLDSDGGVEVIITPTYSGCPAMNSIESSIRSSLEDAGYPFAKVTTVLSPAWTTDWMTDSGKEKLKKYGIAPPQGSVNKHALLFEEPPAVPCPQCASENTEMISQFGSTACKAMYRCLDCLEPFDYFKCH
jgi:ring-1,2-phenylacetyl-CoA epoxidase subunit PaaD